jgi:TRIAD3 protein (E3 ubiquitin-protein ligase RNF216)
VGAEINGVVRCHKCGYIVVFEGHGPMVCPECKSSTCTKCGEPWHDNLTCAQAKELDKERLVEEKMNEAVVRKCPKCHTQFMKDEGCNKMECPRCHTWICYWCRNVIPKSIGYKHFWTGAGLCPPDLCPLWVKNDSLHHVEATKAQADAAKELVKAIPEEV